MRTKAVTYLHLTKLGMERTKFYIYSFVQLVIKY